MTNILLFLFYFFSFAFVNLVPLAATPYVDERGLEETTICRKCLEKEQIPEDWPALHRAIAQKDFELARSIMQKDPSQLRQNAPFVDGHIDEVKGKFNPFYSEILRGALILRQEHLFHGPSAFLLAVKSGSVEFVKEVLDAATEIGFYQSPLFSSDYLEVREAKFYINQNGVFIWDLYVDHISPLWAAIQQEDAAMVALLLDSGIPLQYSGGTLVTSCSLVKGTEPGYDASLESSNVTFSLALNNDEIMRVLIHHLINKKAPINEISQGVIQAYKTFVKQGTSVLHNAIVENDLSSFQFWLRHSVEDLTPIWQIAAQSPNPQFLNCLQHFQPVTGVHQAIQSKDLELVKALIQQHPSVVHSFAPFKDGGWEIGATFVSFSQILRESCKGQLSQELVRGPSALTLGVRSGSMEIVQELLQAGADVNSQHLEVYESSQSGKQYVISAKEVTPLIAAIELKDLNIIKLLLEQGAHFHIDQRLLKAKCEHFHQRRNLHGDGYAWNTFDITENSQRSTIRNSMDNDEILRILLHYQTNKKVAPQDIPQRLLDVYRTYEVDNVPALHAAMSANDVDSFALLLAYSASPELKHAGKTVWEGALEHSNRAFFSLLKNHVPEQLLQALMYAMRLGHLEGVQTWLDVLDLQKFEEDEAALKELFRAGFTSGNVEVVDYLLSRGLKHPELFLFAVEVGNVDMVKLVLHFHQPSQEEVRKAIKIALQKPVEEMLDMLYSLIKV